MTYQCPVRMSPTDQSPAPGFRFETANVGLLLLLGFLAAAASTPRSRAEEASWSHHSYWGPLYQPAPGCPNLSHSHPRPGTDPVHRWNQIAIDASGLDHTPVGPGEDRVFGEQLGPGRASRAMAIVHIAIFDTLNAPQGWYESYTGVRCPNTPVIPSLAVAQAARDTLSELFPSQTARFDAFLAEDLKPFERHFCKAGSIALGRTVAAAILKMREDDGADRAEPRVGVDWIPSLAPGHWRQDPISRSPLALGAYWGQCVPFVLESASQFRVPPPPALGSREYAVAFNEVKRLGGDGITTPTRRTPEQTQIGIFWAYDGTPSLCAPPRLYNQIAVDVADQLGTDPFQLARLLALLNVAMADSAMAVWESKYFYDLWRPVTGIREADAGTGPTGLGDGNPLTTGDARFTPLGAPASNLSGPNFTPPFPSYPSGHAGIGGTVFQILRRFYGTDAVRFRFVSDEFNGVTRGSDGRVRPYLPRTYYSFSQAEEENGQSRIYLGIHWSFDKTRGIEQGRKVADYVFDNVFQQRRSRRE